MKKWIIALLLLFTLMLLFLYLFIPDQILVNAATLIPVKQKTIYRIIEDNNEWKKWWPGEKKLMASNDTMLYRSNNNIGYTIKEKTITSIFININDGNYQIKSSLDFIPITADSTKLEWALVVPAAFNPISRIKNYLFCKKIKEDITLGLEKIKSFYSNTENLYGVKINREQVKDSLLVSTFDSSKGYPTTVVIYAMVDQLKQYIRSQSATESGSPMLNVYTKDSVNYLTRVAIPTNKKLTSSGKISYKWMLGNGNILVSDVKGDNKTVALALKEMDNYVLEHQLAAPAIPFYSLITNRLLVKDSTKWITKIYYPVMFYKD